MYLLLAFKKRPPVKDFSLMQRYTLLITCETYRQSHSARVLDPLVRPAPCPLPRAVAVERGVRPQLPLRPRVHHAGCSESMIRRAKQRMHVQASALTMT
jgi:hypothetical protein